MTKSNWLILIAILCFNVCFGQAPADGAGIIDQSLPGTRDFFSDFSATVKNGHSVRIQWKTVYLPEGEYFIVERSADENHYETVSALKIVDTLSGYELISNAPVSGTYFYRIKWIDKSGNFIYSKILAVKISADFDFKFYPNPADKLLIIRTAHAIDMEVLDGVGTVRMNKQLSSGLQIINVSSLEKGNYVLRVADKESNRVFSAQLLKN